MNPSLVFPFDRPKVPIYDRGRNEDELGDDGFDGRNGSPLRRSPYRQLGPSRFVVDFGRLILRTYCSTDGSEHERTGGGGAAICFV